MSDLASVMGGAFVADDVEITDFEPVPEGEYPVAITAAELKGTSKGGTMLVLDYAIMNGPNESRVIKDRLNVNCPGSPKAEDIAKQSLAKICKAIGIGQLSSTTELVGKRLKIKVVVKPGEGTYIDNTGAERQRSAQNDVKAYYSMNAPTQLKEATPAQTENGAEADLPPADGAPPWAK